MKVSLRQIRGPWDDGWVLDRHTLKSTYVGDNEYGHPIFDTQRTEAGEATYQLKYRGDLTQAKRLADAGFIVPMPASTKRPRQPVSEVVRELGALVARPVFAGMLTKAATGKSMKDIHTKAEKLDAIGAGFAVIGQMPANGRWNVLLVDDLFDTGATMEAACAALRTYSKIQRIYVAALTWK